MRYHETRAQNEGALYHVSNHKSKTLQKYQRKSLS